MNTLLAILKVTDARRDLILAGGLYQQQQQQVYSVLPFCTGVTDQNNNNKQLSLRKCRYDGTVEYHRYISLETLPPPPCLSAILVCFKKSINGQLKKKIKEGNNK